MNPPSRVSPVPARTRTAPAGAASGRRSAGALVLACVLLVHTGAAQARFHSQPTGQPQPEPAPAPAPGPTAPTPSPPQPPPNYPQPPQQPPGYPPPPPRGPTTGYPTAPSGQGYYPQSYYPAQPAPRQRYRPFTLGMGLGVGALSFYDNFGQRAAEPGLSYTLRVGFGITRTWLIFLGAEGIGVNDDDAGVWHTGYVVGAQCFFLERFYARAGLGLSTATIQDDSVAGQALMAAAGFEFAQGYSTSLAVELAFTGARYPSETWSNGGLNFVLSFY